MGKLTYREWLERQETILIEAYNRADDDGLTGAQEAELLSEIAVVQTEMMTAEFARPA